MFPLLFSLQQLLHIPAALLFQLSDEVFLIQAPLFRFDIVATNFRRRVTRTRRTSIGSAHGRSFHLRLARKRAVLVQLQVADAVGI